VARVRGKTLKAKQKTFVCFSGASWAIHFIGAGVAGYIFRTPTNVVFKAPGSQTILRSGTIQIFKSPKTRSQICLREHTSACQDPRLDQTYRAGVAQRRFRPGFGWAGLMGGAGGCGGCVLFYTKLGPKRDRVRAPEVVYGGLELRREGRGWGHHEQRGPQATDTSANQGPVSK
jgi:hypothetical protein